MLRFIPKLWEIEMGSNVNQSIPFNFGFLQSSTRYVISQVQYTPLQKFEEFDLLLSRSPFFYWISIYQN